MDREAWGATVHRVAKNWTQLSTIMFDSLQPLGLWSGLPCPPVADLPDPGIEPYLLISPALAGGFFTLASPVKPLYTYIQTQKYTDHRPQIPLSKGLVGGGEW